MSRKLMVGALAVFACALTSMEADATRLGSTVEEARSKTTVAQKWLDGTLQDYGVPPLEYSGEPIVMRATHHQPETSTIAKVHKGGFRRLEEMSGGKIKVDDTWGGIVHNVKDGRNAIRTGLTDFAPCYSLYHAGDYQLVNGLGLPFLFDSPHTAVAVAEALYREYLADEFERFGVGLGRLGMTSLNHLFAKTPIKSLDDYAGMKVRSGGGMNTRMIEALGAVPIQVPSTGAYTAMQRGVVDAVQVSDTMAPIMGIDQLAEYRMGVGLNLSPVETCVNPQWLASLPPDLKRVFAVWARQMAQVEAQIFYGVDDVAALEKMREGGVEVIDLQDAEMERWRERLAPLAEQWIAEMEGKGLPGERFMADVRRLSAEYAAKTPDELMQMTIDDPVMDIYSLE